MLLVLEDKHKEHLSFLNDVGTDGTVLLSGFVKRGRGRNIGNIDRYCSKIINNEDFVLVMIINSVQYQSSKNVSFNNKSNIHSFKS